MEFEDAQFGSFVLKREDVSDYSKVLVVSFSAVPAPDRHGVQLHNVIKALAPRYELDVMSLRAGDLPYVEKYLNARMLRVPVAEVDIREQVEVFRRAVRRQIEGNDYEAIHFRSAYGGKPICERRGYLESRLVFEVAISPFAQPRPADTSLTATLAEEERYCLSCSDLVLASSTLAANHLVSMRPGLSVSVLTQGVDVDFFDWEEAPPKTQRHVVYAGRIGPGRGVRTLLKAFAEVVAQVDVCLVLVGPVESGFEVDLATSIEEMSLQGRVTHVGAVKHVDMPRMLALADVCVAPRVPDSIDQPLAGYPNKVLEAMACRRATVVPRCPLMEEIAGEWPCFGFFQGDSAGDLAGVLLRLLTNETERQMVADAAYERIRSAFTASSTRRNLIASYRALLPNVGSIFQARPGLNQVPGVLSADPETSTARRFHDFHDTATLSGPPPRGGWTPTGKRAPTVKMSPVTREVPVENSEAPAAEAIEEKAPVTQSGTETEAGDGAASPLDTREGRWDSKRDDVLPEITPADVVEVIEAEFVAAGDLLSSEVRGEVEAEVQEAQTPPDSE